GAWIRGRGDDIARCEFGVRVRDSYGRMQRPDVDAHNHALVVEAQVDRTTAARWTSGGALFHPARVDQLLHDRRHRAALQAGEPRHVATRARLAFADEIQHN